MHHRDRPGPDEQRERQARSEQHDAGLDVKLDAQSGIDPAGNADGIGNQQPHAQRNQRRLQIVMRCLIPQTEKIDRAGGDKNRQERRHETAKPRCRAPAAPAPNSADHSDEAAPRIEPRCSATATPTSDRWLHFCGATASHLMLPPAANTAAPAAINDRPMQMPSQSSLRTSAPIREPRVGDPAGDCSAICKMGDSSFPEPH